MYGIHFVKSWENDTSTDSFAIHHGRFENSGLNDLLGGFYDWLDKPRIVTLYNLDIRYSFGDNGHCFEVVKKISE